MFLIILLYALFGSSFPISKTLLGFVDPIFLTGIRMFIAGSILLIYQYFFAHAHFTFRVKNIFYYLQVIIFGIYLTYILRFYGLAQLGSAKTAFLFNSAPFFAALYSYIMFREKLTKQQILGLFIGFIGFIPLLVACAPAEKNWCDLFFISWYELIVLAAVACQSYSWIVMRRLIREKSYAPTMINGMTMFAGGVLALLTSIFIETPPTISNPTSFFSLLILVIGVSNIICHNLYAHLLKRYTATFLAFTGFLGPLFSAFYGWIFLKEIISWHFFVSAGIVFFGLYLFYQHELQVVGIEKNI